ncbi:MAG: hypothetical protein HWN66_18845 [Candidatus Helarchaeota archaeon]|nr:hypothetical protein [Candidatus Helarchaeota archaeon]
MELRAREGDFIETDEGLIFDVKGLIHPPERVIAYLRYYPDPNGHRIRDRIRYKKVYSLDSRYEYLKSRYPLYLFHDKISGERLQGIPRKYIKSIFHPEGLMKKVLQRGRNVEQRKMSILLQKTFELAKLIQSQSGINFNKIGITGSFLVDLETDESDIDLIIYGSRNANIVKKALTTLHSSHQIIIHPYSEKNISDLYEARGKISNLQFDEFVKIEQRKKLQGVYKETDYYIRCIKDWNEIQYKYGDVYYKNLGIATIQGKIIDDTESILTPCKYSIETSKVIDGIKITEQIREIVSFRGRFCEQAQKGEEIEARGKVELVRFENEEYLRLYLGTYNEDYFKILNL